MATYLVIKNNQEIKSYKCKSDQPAKPYIKVSNEYLGLTDQTTTGLRMVAKVNGKNYVPVQTISTSISSTTETSYWQYNTYSDGLITSDGYTTYGDYRYTYSYYSMMYTMRNYSSSRRSYTGYSTFTIYPTGQVSINTFATGTSGAASLYASKTRSIGYLVQSAWDKSWVKITADMCKTAYMLVTSYTSAENFYYDWSTTNSALYYSSGFTRTTPYNTTFRKFLMKIFTERTLARTYGHYRSTINTTVSTSTEG